MTILAGHFGATQPHSLFSDNQTRVISGANVYFSENSANLLVDSIYAKVVDSRGVQQYLLTTNSGLTINDDNVYIAEDIDVSAFPHGNVTITWVASIDGINHTFVDVIQFSTEATPIVVTGLTDTLNSGDLFLGEDKLFNIKITNSVGLPAVCSGVRVAIEDQTWDASEKAPGFWETTVSGVDTVPGDYQYWWEASQGSNYYEVANSRYPLRIYGVQAGVHAEPQTYSTNADIRRTFPGVDTFLSAVAPDQAERDAIISQHRIDCSETIKIQFNHTVVRKHRELLRQLEVREAYKSILCSAHGFAKFGQIDKQIALLDARITQIRRFLNGPITTIRIG